MGWHSWKGDKRDYRKKNARMLYSDYMNSLSSNLSLEAKDSLLDEYLEDLCPTRRCDYYTRVYAMRSIFEEFQSGLEDELVETISTTLLHRCLHIIKYSRAAEASWAAELIGFLALTTGPGEKAQEILKKSVDIISEALKKPSNMSSISSLLRCLAIITFVGGEALHEIDKSMRIIWQMAHPRFDTNVAATKLSPAVIETAVSSWSFLLTAMDHWSFNPNGWQGSMSYLSTLLDNDYKYVRTAAGLAVALTFEMGSPEKFCGETEMHLKDLQEKVLNQVSDLSAGSKGSSQNGRYKQRNTFRDILHFLKDSTRTPETLIKIGGKLLRMGTWAQLIQWNFLRGFVGQGFLKHVQGNEFLRDVFGFTPKKTLLSGYEKNRMSQDDMAKYKLVNSWHEKRRTRDLNKDRTYRQVTKIDP